MLFRLQFLVGCQFSMHLGYLFIIRLNLTTLSQNNRFSCWDNLLSDSSRIHKTVFDSFFMVNQSLRQQRQQSFILSWVLVMEQPSTLSGLCYRWWLAGGTQTPGGAWWAWWPWRWRGDGERVRFRGIWGPIIHPSLPSLLELLLGLFWATSTRSVMSPEKASCEVALLVTLLVIFSSLKISEFCRSVCLVRVKLSF